MANLLDLPLELLRRAKAVTKPALAATTTATGEKPAATTPADDYDDASAQTAFFNSEYLLPSGSGRSTKPGGVAGGQITEGPYKGKTDNTLRVLANERWKQMSMEERRRWMPSKNKAPGEAAPPPAASGTGTAPMRFVPPAVGGGLGSNAAPTSSATVSDALPAAQAAVQRVKTAQDAANGIVRTASGSVVTPGTGPDGRGIITPTGPNGAKVLASGYGSGSVTQAAPGAARKPAVFYGTNKGDNTPMTFAQATGRAPLTPAAPAAPASPATAPTAPAPAPAPATRQPQPAPPVLAQTRTPNPAPWQTQTNLMTKPVNNKGVYPNVVNKGGQLTTAGTPLVQPTSPSKPLLTNADTNPARANEIKADPWSAGNPTAADIAAKKALAAKTAATIQAYTGQYSRPTPPTLAKTR